MPAAVLLVMRKFAALARWMAANQRFLDSFASGKLYERKSKDWSCVDWNWEEHNGDGRFAFLKAKEKGKLKCKMHTLQLLLAGDAPNLFPVIIAQLVY